MIEIKHKIIYISILFIAMFSLAGCSSEAEFESFSLQQIGTVDVADTENPTLYLVSPSEAKGTITIFYNEIVDETTGDSEIVEHDLEETSVTDDEIIIRYEDGEEVFERRSSTVAVNENDVQYQYADE